MTRIGSPRSILASPKRSEPPHFVCLTPVHEPFDGWTIKAPANEFDGSELTLEVSVVRVGMVKLWPDGSKGAAVTITVRDSATREVLVSRTGRDSTMWAIVAFSEVIRDYGVPAMVRLVSGCAVNLGLALDEELCAYAECNAAAAGGHNA